MAERDPPRIGYSLSERTYAGREVSDIEKNDLVVHLRKRRRQRRKIHLQCFPDGYNALIWRHGRVWSNKELNVLNAFLFIDLLEVGPIFLGWGCIHRIVVTASVNKISHISTKAQAFYGHDRTLGYPNSKDFSIAFLWTELFAMP